MGDEQARSRQRLQNLGQQRWRDVIGLGDILGTLGGVRVRTRGGAWLLGEVLERHQTVIRFFGQTKHFGLSLWRTRLPAGMGGIVTGEPNQTLLVLDSVRRERGRVGTPPPSLFWGLVCTAV